MARTAKSLVMALYETPPAPCGVGGSTCVFSAKCKAEQLACTRFAYYVEHAPPLRVARKGAWNRMVYRTMSNTDQPSRAVYEDIYGSEDKDGCGRPAKLSPTDVEAIQYQLSRGVTQTVLADEFMVHRKVIQRIERGERAVHP